MEEKAVLKESSNGPKARELAEVILRESISDQNEIFDMLRRRIIEARYEFIANLMDGARKLADEIDYAESSLKNIIIAELK